MELTEIEKNNCQLFNTGRFNNIVLAYLVMSMRKANIPADTASDLLAAHTKILGEMTAEEALERFHG